jgi:hypothetical protein
MSDCYTAKDVNFPNSGSKSMVTGLYRPALARVWHGMLLLMETQGRPGKPEAMQASMYDPYAGMFTSIFPQSAGPQAVAGPALFYADLFTWIFYSDGTDFVCASAPQPAPSSQNNNQIPFDDFQFGSASVVAENTTAINPTVVLFNGQVYVFWTDAPQPGAYNTIYFTSAPYQPSADGTTAPTLAFGSVMQLVTFVGAISEPSLAVYNGSLYCAYRGQSGFTQVLTLSPDGTSLGAQTVTTETLGCGELQCTYAPTIAADPKGTFLAMVFCKPGSYQLCTTYLSVESSVWSDPQLISGQTTNLSPTLITTGGNRGYVGYSRTDGKGTNLTVSGYLPLIQA